LKRVKSTPLRVFFLLLLLFFFHRAFISVSQTGRERWCHHHHHARVRRHHGWNEGIICAVLHLRSRQVHVRKPLKRVHARILRGRRGKFRRRFVNNFPRNVVGGDSREQIARYLFENARKRIKSQCEWINARKKRSRVQFNLEIKEKRIARWPLTRGPFSVFRSISLRRKYQIFAFEKNKNEKSFAKSAPETASANTAAGQISRDRPVFLRKSPVFRRKRAFQSPPSRKGNAREFLF